MSAKLPPTIHAREYLCIVRGPSRIVSGASWFPKTLAADSDKQYRTANHP
jgi:hypothetical protein